MSVVTFAVYM